MRAIVRAALAWLRRADLNTIAVERLTAYAVQDRMDARYVRRAEFVRPLGVRWDA